MLIKEAKTTGLHQLKNGDSAVIVKALGHGSFRKRIMEMGFVTGAQIKVIKSAPLQDPVEYEIMGYRVSLRKSEAELIEVVSESEAALLDDLHFNNINTIPVDKDPVQNEVKARSKTINIAFVGNPNCGKTTLFNFATGRNEKVGNYGGVTVDLKTAKLQKKGYTFNITDLPGTYSISDYSAEEIFVRNHLYNEKPDIVVNVIDASNLERNLYLTTQLIDMNIKVVIALNMFDELEKKEGKLDVELLGNLLGIPISPTIGSKGKGIDELFERMIEVYEDLDPVHRNMHINYGNDLNRAISKIEKEIKKHESFADKFYPRYAAIRMIENDSTIAREMLRHKSASEIIFIADKEIQYLEKETGQKAETLIANHKYGFIKGALKEAYPGRQEAVKKSKYSIDDILTHKWLGFPIFLFFMWAAFQITFTLGAFPMDWIDAGVTILADLVKTHMPEGALRDLLADGIISGVGGVLVFLPNILILFFCISLMEDTGYMARAAFIMDRLMHKIGLHGKSFIPLLMGFGCNVPAVMATRTLENRKDRILTMLIVPFMSCSARLPVYVLIISSFFVAHQGLALLSIYLIGIFLAILTGMVFKKLFFKKEDVPFVMELPPYRIPTLRNTSIHMWDKSVQYLSKMGTVILAASILIWALGYFPREAKQAKVFDEKIAAVNNSFSLTTGQKTDEINKLEVAKESERLAGSYIGRLGHLIQPVIAPLGFDWKIGVSIITGIAAKEIMIGSMGVLYQSGLEDDQNSVSLKNKLKQQEFTSGERKGEKVFSPLTAFTLMLFVLVYFPCVAVIAAIKREASWKWAIISTVYTTALAWILAFITYRIGGLFL